MRLVEFTTSVQKIRYEVLREVSYLAFNDQLDDGLDEVPYKIISGSKARFRCCIYKEREIVRERVRLACGLLPYGAKGNRKDGQIVYVIEEACEGCPISRFQVTENCQGCMTKRCREACPFGAITIAGKRAYIDQDKCRECGRCKDACPYNAIADLMRPCKRSCPVDAISMDEDKKAVIDEGKCINCGACVRECPFGAMADISYIVDVIEEIKGKGSVYAIFAPSIEGQFAQDINVNMIKGALLELGFDGAFEVALGADAIALHEAEEVLEAIDEGKFKTTSCCPAFVSMVDKHFPKLIPNISNTVSPMVAMARYIKEKDPKGKVVFIGPCMAKKHEMISDWARDYVDYVLTFEEIIAMLDAKKIEFDEERGEREASTYGVGFAQSGGVVNAVNKIVKEKQLENKIIPRSCNGATECKKALAIANAGKLMENLIEGMVCEGGCIGGPGSITETNTAKRNINKKIIGNNIDKITENVKKFNFDSIDLDKKI